MDERSVRYLYNVGLRLRTVNLQLLFTSSRFFEELQIAASIPQTIVRHSYAIRTSFIFYQIL